MQTIMAMTKRDFPLIPWESLNSSSSIVVNARLFNQLQLFFSAHGAGFSNALFMQPRTVLCEVSNDRGYTLYMELSSILGLYHVVARLTAMKHHSLKETAVPLSLAQKMIKAGLQCLGMFHNSLSRS
jgi:capsular polysaccharide biosynthesis protein